MLPIRVGPTTGGAVPTGAGEAPGLGAPEEMGGAPGIELGTVPVAFRVADMLVSHIWPGMTMETSRRTPDHGTSPLSAVAVRTSRAATVCLRTANSWSW